MEENVKDAIYLMCGLLAVTFLFFGFIIRIFNKPSGTKFTPSSVDEIEQRVDRDVHVFTINEERFAEQKNSWREDFEKSELLRPTRLLDCHSDSATPSKRTISGQVIDGPKQGWH